MPMFGMGASMTDEERRRLAAMQQSGGMPDQPISYTPGAQRAMDNAPRLQEGQKRQSFWQGGDKFTARDGIAGALAAVGDGLNNWANGGGGGATNMLVGGRINAMEEAKKARAQAEAAAQRQADLAAVGIDPARGRLLGDSVGGVVAGQMKPPEMTEFEKRMIGGGIDPKSPEGIALQRQYAERTAQGPQSIIQGGRLPGGGEFTGTLSDYERMVNGGRQPAPQRAAPGPRPQGMTDQQLFDQAREAVGRGADVNEVFERLKAWGVKAY